MGYPPPLIPGSAKIHRSYSVEEIARLFNVHKNTVRSWLQAGPGGHRRPAPDRGPWEAIRRFLSRAPGAREAGLRPGRIYCLPAARPKVPAGKWPTAWQTGDTTGTLRGICPDCDRMIYRTVNPQKIAAVRGDLDVTLTQARARIEETAKPNVNCDSKGGPPMTITTPQTSG